MTLDTWILYVGTVLLFMSTPGPSHLLMISVSMTNGFQRSLATAAGDLTANAIQILLAGLGLAAVVTSSRHGFLVIKWLGVAYLAWMGLRMIIHSFRAGAEARPLPAASLQSLWLRGFLTSAANPKAVVFFAALFPQFLNTEAALWPQIAVLGATYIAIDGSFLAAYGKGASWLANKMASGLKPVVDRLAGASLMGAAVLLGVRGVER